MNPLNWLQKQCRVRPRARRTGREKRDRLGRNSVVDPSVQVYGWKNIRVGSDTIVSEETLINAMNRETDEVTLSIGDNCFIGRCNYFNVGGGEILWGSYCLTANDCRFLGTDHKVDDPFVPYLAGTVSAEEDIVIGANCWLGCAVTMLKNVHVGYGSIIGAATVVTGNIPPLSIVVGNPGRVVKRYSLNRKQWLPASEYSAEEQLPDETAYLARLRQCYPYLRGPLQGSSRRFGDF
ncbi:MAG: acyltransferase [Terrimicrobiaceae bacterium]